MAERKPGDYVTAADLTAHPAMAILMREAVLPNLVQNLEGGPALIHGGPFGNIAHGCNSLIATQLALKLADLVVTEAGFGADLGAEKFFNIKCPAGGLRPRVAVLVATVRALKLHGGASKRDLVNEDLNALRAGLPNLEAHAENLRKFGVPVVIAVNRFPTDTDAEVDAVMAAADRLGAPAAVSTVFSDGGAGGEDLARRVVATLEAGEDHFKPLYEPEASLTEKIEVVAREIYGADGVDYAAGVARRLRRLDRGAAKGFPICMAKTQYSLSDSPALLGRPSGFRVTVRDVRLSAGAGFVVPLTGDILTMPGLPRRPFAVDMDVAQGRDDFGPGVGWPGPPANSRANWRDWALAMCPAIKRTSRVSCGAVQGSRKRLRLEAGRSQMRRIRRAATVRTRVILRAVHRSSGQRHPAARPGIGPWPERARARSGSAKRPEAGRWRVATAFEPRTSPWRMQTLSPGQRPPGCRGGGPASP